MSEQPEGGEAYQETLEHVVPDRVLGKVPGALMAERGRTNQLSAADQANLATANEGPAGRRSVLQDWVHGLTLMQQSVLITACRGPDGLHKEHPAKSILRWLRRCFLLSAFDRRVLETASEPGGGSFTGPILSSLTHATVEYLRSVDEVPHHFHLHLMHASEILGYKHPVAETREWWHDFYLEMVNDMHLYPETEEQMRTSLGDNEQAWREREHVPARK